MSVVVGCGQLVACGAKDELVVPEEHEARVDHEMEDRVVGQSHLYQEVVAGSVVYRNVHRALRPKRPSVAT